MHHLGGENHYFPLTHQNLRNILHHNPVAFCLEFLLSHLEWPCLAGIITAIRGYPSSAAFALCTAVNLSIAYVLVVADCVFSWLSEVRCPPCHCRRA